MSKFKWVQRLRETIVPPFDIRDLPVVKRPDFSHLQKPATKTGRMDAERHEQNSDKPSEHNR
jgi:hypothetical protein